MFATGTGSLFYKDLLQEVSEESILQYYTGISEIPCLIKSPLREEVNPSFSVFYSKTGRIHFKDFGNSESYNLTGFLMRLLNLDINKIMSKLYQDIEKFKVLDIEYINTGENKRHYDRRISKTTVKLQVTTRAWLAHDIEYWEQYGINKDWLEYANIYPISRIFLHQGINVPAEKYAYCYVEFKDNIPTLKVYQPYSKNYKWMNSHDSSVWDLWSQAMRSNSDSLIITSSRKDALTLWANIGVPSISLQSENTLPKPHIVKQLKDRFKNIWILYDNDTPGKTASSKLVEEYNFKHIEIPTSWEAKDPSDLYKKHGKEVFIQEINKLIKTN